eukprot:gnl/TRDRNA2_/TRDRNA2_72615_c0_seq1.p1 gnl/TRDRNA2_/TRDRNA2_72615_c0~~gnl/TRDRNA2_/TRDRNA2_72615_c0_seq1.p1  ORF type:complete len:248 (-),score=25.85 gnl/TRDRNA2_/TRDRNA2_72615_c0_seq1:48-791(-)
MASKAHQGMDAEEGSERITVSLRLISGAELVAAQARCQCTCGQLIRQTNDHLNRDLDTPTAGTMADLVCERERCFPSHRFIVALVLPDGRAAGLSETLKELGVTNGMILHCVVSDLTVGALMRELQSENATERRKASEVWFDQIHHCSNRFMEAIIDKFVDAICDSVSCDPCENDHFLQPLQGLSSIVEIVQERHASHLIPKVLRYHEEEDYELPEQQMLFIHLCQLIEFGNDSVRELAEQLQSLTL